MTRRLPEPDLKLTRRNLLPEPDLLQLLPLLRLTAAPAAVDPDLMRLLPLLDLRLLHLNCCQT